MHPHLRHDWRAIGAARLCDLVLMMRKHQIGALPVVQDGRLIGLITEHDFLDIAAELLDGKLREK